MVGALQSGFGELFPHVIVIPAGRVPQLEAERMTTAVARLLQRFHLPAQARIRMTTLAGETENGPILTQVNVMFDSAPVRVQTLTRGRGDALPVVLRLARQLESLSSPRRPRGWPDPTRPPLGSPGGGIGRRKHVAPIVHTPAAAARVMDRMDYDVHLFTDADTGDDAIVYRAGPTGARLARQHRTDPPRDGLGPFTLVPRPAPTLTEPAAADRLRGHGLPFLFYTDPATARGHLLYRRYDNRLTLLTPANTPP